MADGSSRVVYAALIGNVLVAGSKFGAAIVSGSSAMLTEAVHSTADCVNQLLLLIGVRRGKLPADESHPFGYGVYPQSVFAQACQRTIAARPGSGWMIELRSG